MSSEFEQLVQAAIAEAKLGNRRKAGEILTGVIKQDPQNARAWYLLSQVVDNQDQSIHCLKQVLIIQPENIQANERLHRIAPQELNQLSAVQGSNTLISDPDQLTFEELAEQTSCLQSYFDELVTRFPDLQSFQEAARWKSDAAALINLFEQFEDKLNEYKKQEEHSLQEAKNDRERLPALKRSVASQDIEKFTSKKY